MKKNLFLNICLLLFLSLHTLTCFSQISNYSRFDNSNIHKILLNKCSQCHSIGNRSYSGFISHDKEQTYYLLINNNYLNFYSPYLSEVMSILNSHSHIEQAGNFKSEKKSLLKELGDLSHFH